LSESYSEAGLSAVVESLVDALLVFDEAGRIVFANRAAGALFGTAASELLGQSLDALLPERFRGAHSAHVGRFVASKEPSRHLTQARLITGLRADGREVKLDATISQVRIDGALRLAILMRDASPRLELEREVADFQRRVAQIERVEALSTLSAGIAHDFNNTLTVILALCQSHVATPHLDGALAEDLREVVAAAERAAGLARRLLMLGHKPVAALHAFDASATAQEVARLVGATAPASIELEVSTPGPAYIHADESLLSQALLNLCTNALHAMQQVRQGPAALRLSVAHRRHESPLATFTCTLPPGPYVCVRVSDTGAGIAPEVLPRVFEPFFTTKEVGQGTGLGLAMVHRLMVQANGGIQVHSTVGRGTTFELDFPLAPAPQVPKAQASEGTFTPPPATRGRRVLLVDDDLFVCAALQRSLRALGYTCHALSDPRDAAALVRADPRSFDVVVTDYDMPGMTGLELCRALHAMAPSIMLVLVSGSEEAAPAPAPTPFVTRLHKPLSAGALHDALVAMTRSRAEPEPAALARA
jgi:PAS domain S-box-containing protein